MMIVDVPTGLPQVQAGKNALVTFRASPEELAKFQTAEMEKWGRIIKAAGIQLE